MTNTVVLDTQLMVLLAVGIASRSIIPKHKNLTEFTEDDFDLLVVLIGTDPELVLISNIISEAANLLRQHRNPERAQPLKTFAEVIRLNREHYVESIVAAGRREYAWLGITDAAILEVCQRTNSKILTADAELYLVAASSGLEATNFNHKREEYGLL